jgi:hypothetical protein
MNALSRLTARTKVVTALVAAVCVVAMISTMIRAMGTEPKIEIAFLHFEKRAEDQYAVVDIRNVGNGAALFTGYSPAEPLCDLVHKDSAGNWQNRILRCGFGLSDHLLLPGAHVRTTNYIHGAGNFKIGFTYKKPSIRDRLPARLDPLLAFLPRTYGPYQKVWTPEIPALPVEMTFSELPDSAE